MKQILFVELLGGIGDVLIALSAIQALGRSYPEAKLTVLTFAPGGELLQTDPLVGEVVFAQKGQAKSAIAQLLAQRSFDLIVSDTTYDDIDQVIQASGARVVTNLWRSPLADQFVSDRFLQILLAEGLITPTAIRPPQLHLATTERDAIASDLDNLARPIVVLYPDAGMPIKRWPVENFVNLGQKLQAQLGGTIVVPIASNPKEAKAMVAAIGGSAQTWPQSSLRAFAAMLSHTNLMIAPDTGPARIAAALSVPTITLFGPSWHQRYGQPTPHLNLQGYSACPERVIQNFTVQRCWYGGTCPFDEWNTCLEEISVDRVMANAIALLESQTCRS